MIIKSALRPLRKEPLAIDQARRAAADIEEEVSRLNRIVSEVLDFARPIRFELAPIDVNAVCEAAVRAAWPGEADPPVGVHLDPAIPPCLLDADRLRQALVNVLANARHASAARNSEPRVTLRTSRAQGQVRITIRDNGPGIPPQALARVFEPFFTTTPSGSGIGLAITRNIIEGLGGAIAVARSDADGTEILIELPLPAPAAAAGTSRG
jgi:signal transduction histidine kinase